MDTANPSYQRLMKTTYCITLGLVICHALLVDVNGDILGLGHVLSILLGTSIYCVAGVAAALLSLTGRRLWRIVGLASVVLYGLRFLPLVGIVPLGALVCILLLVRPAR